MKRVLVTGSNGFVGRALLADLLARGIDTVAALRQAEWTPHVPAAARRVAVGMIGPETDWQGALDGVDTVFHLAGVAHSGIAEDAETVARYENVNVAGSAALARQAAAAGARRLIFLSSVKVNGERTAPDRPFTEDDDPRPEDIYGRSKWKAEQALAALGRETGLEIVTLRSPLVHGPGVGGNLASFLRLCDSPWPLPFGALTRNRRSLVGRANLASALLLCGEHPAAAGETFLIRDGEDLSTAALAGTLRRAVGRPQRLLPVPAAVLRRLAGWAGRAGMAERLTGSLTVDDGKLRRHLGWRPVMTAEQGLSAMAKAARRLRKS